MPATGTTGHGVVEDEVKKLLAAADLRTVTVKMLAAQVRERLPDVGLDGKPLRQVVRAAVDAYMAAQAGDVGDAEGKTASGGSNAEAAASGGASAAAPVKVGGAEGAHVTDSGGPDKDAVKGPSAEITDGDADANDVDDGAAIKARANGKGGKAAPTAVQDVLTEEGAAAPTKREAPPASGDDQAESDGSLAAGGARRDGADASDASAGASAEAAVERKRPPGGSRPRGPAKKRRRTSGGSGGGGGGGSGGGDDAVARLLDLVTAVGLSRRSAVLSTARLRDADAKAARLRRLLEEKAGMRGDPLTSGRAGVAAAKKEVERRELLGGLDSGNIVSGGRRRRSTPVSYTEPPVDVLDELLKEEEAEVKAAAAGAAAGGAAGATGEVKTKGRRVVADGSDEEGDAAKEGAGAEEVKGGDDKDGVVEADGASAKDGGVALADAPAAKEGDGDKADTDKEEGSEAGDESDPGEEPEEDSTDDDDDDFSAGDMSDDE